MIVFPMNEQDEVLGRYTLRIAGLLQEVQNQWARRLENYYTQLESLVEGEWFDSNDLIGIIREARAASREALEGLGTDLSAELLHTSGGFLARFESERSTLHEEISDLRAAYGRAISGDARSVRQENESLFQSIMSVPMFKLLDVVQELNVTNYKELTTKSGMKKADVREHIKSLMRGGFVSINKDKRPHEIIFLSAPWNKRTQEIPSFDVHQIISSDDQHIHLPNES